MCKIIKWTLVSVSVGFLLWAFLSWWEIVSVSELDPDKGNYSEYNMFVQMSEMAEENNWGGK